MGEPEGCDLTQGQRLQWEVRQGPFAGDRFVHGLDRPALVFEDEQAGVVAGARDRSHLRPVPRFQSVEEYPLVHH